MITEPKMPEGLVQELAFWLETKYRRHGELEDKQAATELRRLHERVAELERVLDVARDALEREQRIIPSVRFTEAISTIDAARSKEQWK